MANGFKEKLEVLGAPIAVLETGSIIKRILEKTLLRLWYAMSNKRIFNRVCFLLASLLLFIVVLIS